VSVAEPRRNLSLPVRAELDFEDGTKRVEYAVNLSAGGVCLHVHEPLPEGEMTVTLEVPSGPRLSARARLVWFSTVDAGSAESFIESGLQFVDLPRETRELLSEWAAHPIDRRR
jgi:hypothetical protein